MDGVCGCGNYKCFIHIYWKGKYYEFRKDDGGDLLSYHKALDRLVEINNRIKNKSFRPEDFTESKISERKFENMISKWLLEKKRKEELGELSNGTIKDYSGYVKNYFGFFNGLDVREIDLEKLSDFKDTLSEVSIKTRKNIVNALRNFYYWLKERGVIRETPVFPKVTGDDSKTRRAIDYELQIEVLKRIPEKHRDVIEFLMETGLRPGEACALLREHIDLRRGEARIERTFSSNKLRETTKQKRKRNIPLSERAYQIAEKNCYGKLQKQYLFVNPNSNRNYLPDTLWRIWRAYSAVDVCLYEGTRHSFGSQLIERADVIFVKELMGHSSVKTTEKYLHMKTTRLRDIVNSRKLTRVQNRSELEVSLRDG
jgi:integrase